MRLGVRRSLTLALLRQQAQGLFPIPIILCRPLQLPPSLGLPGSRIQRREVRQDKSGQSRRSGQGEFKEMLLHTPAVNGSVRPGSSGVGQAARDRRPLWFPRSPGNGLGKLPWVGGRKEPRADGWTSSGLTSAGRQSALSNAYLPCQPLPRILPRKGGNDTAWGFSIQPEARVQPREACRPAVPPTLRHREHRLQLCHACLSCSARGNATERGCHTPSHTPKTPRCLQVLLLLTSAGSPPVQLLLGAPSGHSLSSQFLQPLKSQPVTRLMREENPTSTATQRSWI